ncbi:cell shape-determining protein MreB [Hymenobacter aerilatus]|uniref:Cell shape-determining protein MreB n=1 Tax=Hymenobacter aerilatus TaxID=2932251 RepID=A0A8T9SWZ5_9BACT|nr:cell shape-determining protein MreB [Hymenobacter aerilatus]UOR06355.1 cell shape-determining protein MreB [Hymenobacter aerilatus]
MKRIPRLLLMLMLAGAATATTSCNDDNDTAAVNPSGPTDAQGRVILQGNITANRKLVASEKYILQGPVYVTRGVTLEIEPGTVIMGDRTNKGALIIERGAIIRAEGTKERPIVFTSSQAPGTRNYGDWGGLIIAGEAPINRPLEATKMEGGITSGPQGGAFGGTNPTDNSGIIRYVRIEFAGVPLTSEPNSEINGLTLYGVGSGTTIDYVQVSYCGDDSFEWFGGTVNAKHLVAHRGWDDDFDTDLGFTGKIQYAVSLRDPQYADQSSSNGFESDNYNPGTPATGAPTENNGLPLTAPVFSNVSIFVTGGAPPVGTLSGSGPYQSAMHLRRNTSLSVFNSVFVGYPEGLRLDGTTTWANVQNNGMQIAGVTLANMNTPIRAAANTGTGAFTDADVQTWFNGTGKNNAVVTQANLGTLGLNTNNFNLTAPNFLLSSSSSLLTGAVFTGKAADSFFEKVTYRGAFNGSDNWLQGWTNFDPQNTTY